MRSKARDISEIQVTAVPEEITPSSLVVLWTPQAGPNRHPYRIDCRYLAPLGSFGRQLMLEILTQVKDWDRERTKEYVNHIKNYLMKLVARSPEQPACWSVSQWKSFTDEHIATVQRSILQSDGTKNTHRSRVVKFTSGAAKRKLIPSFPVISGIRNPAKKKKTPIAQVPKSDLPGLAMNERFSSIARRLDELVDFNNPDVHQERTTVLLGLLEDFAQEEMRGVCARFEETERWLSAPDGLDVQALVDESLLGKQPLVMKSGWTKHVRTECDVVRLACHPEMLPFVMDRSEPFNAIRKHIHSLGLTRKLWDRIALTTNAAIPFVLHLLLDLNHEPSSALTTKIDGARVSEANGQAILAWTKGRSREEQQAYREIGLESAFDRGSKHKITSFRAIEFLTRLRGRFARFYPAHLSEKLFVVFSGNSKGGMFKVLSLTAALRAWKSMRNRHPILRNYNFSLDKLRSSILLADFLEKKNILHTSAKARHKRLKTTIGYISELAGDMASARSVRELQDALLFSATVGMEELRMKLGMSEGRADHIMSQAKSSGFLQWGLETVHRRKKVDNPQRAANESAFVGWLTGGEIYLIESEEVAAEIYAFRQHLLGEADAIRGSKAWFEDWGPMLVFLNVALNSMRVDVRMAGQTLAEQYDISYMEVAA